MKSRLLTIVMALMFSHNLYAVDYYWWGVKHNWDGVTPWENYMQLTARYSGPNTIPVPEIVNGAIPKNSFFEAGFAGHYYTGDKTTNTVLSTLIKAGNKAAIGLYYVPFEFYWMDTAVSRNERNTRDYDGKGKAVGDVYINAYYQILKNKPKRFDLMLSFGVKTASGTNLEAARYNDCPGYYFHLSGGYTWTKPNAFFKTTRLYAMAGAYMWQTYRDDYKQDDAPLFGAGITLENKNFVIDEHIGGYMGYFNMGDKPVVSRLSLRTNRDKLFNYKLLYQHGLNDFLYKSVVISSVVNLEKIHLGHKKRVKENNNG